MEIVSVALIKWFLTIMVYLSIIIIRMLYMFMYLFNYIVFVIVMDMPCDIVSGVTCIIYFLCKILIISNVQ